MMNRTETFPAASTGTLSVRLSAASLEVCSDDVDEIIVQVTGDDDSEDDLRLTCASGHLTVQQPLTGLLSGHAAALQVSVRLPLSWKGAAELHTVTGAIRVQGLSGSDLSCVTVSGPIDAAGLCGITVTFRTVSGELRAEDVSADRLTLRTVTGSASVNSAVFPSVRARSLTGDISLGFAGAFDRMTASSLSGTVSVALPAPEADVTLRSLSGRIRTDGGIALRGGGSRLCARTLTGDLELIGI